MPNVSGNNKDIGIVMLEPKMIPIIGCKLRESVIYSNPRAKIVDNLPNNTQNPRDNPLIFVGNNSAQ